MGGNKSPSPPAAPPPPNPVEAARANDLYYRSSLETYLQTQPEIAKLDNSIREKYAPRQRELDREMSALDLQKSALAQLQVERELGPQRSLEQMKRQFEMNPNAFATQQAFGQQAALQFARLYGQNPMGAVPGAVQQGTGLSPVDYLSAAGRNRVG
jgi:hypothetical protein